MKGNVKEWEDDEWMQILHDIMYTKPKDESGGQDGELLL